MAKGFFVADRMAMGDFLKSLQLDPVTMDNVTIHMRQVHGWAAMTDQLYECFSGKYVGGEQLCHQRSFVQFVDDQVEDWERILRHVQTIVIPEHRSIDDLEQELHGLVGIQTVITAVAERVRTELAARRGEVAEAAGAGRHEFVPTVAGAGVPRAFAGGIGDEGVAAGPVRRERRGAEHHRRLAEVGATAEAIAGGPRATRVGRFPERVRVPFQELPRPFAFV
eukprot:jgi/Mesvir1/4808/Mv11102-RA.1